MTISGIKMAPKAKNDTRIGTIGEQLPTAKSTSKKRIVSSPRIKGEPKIGVSVRLTPTQIQRLDELREPQKLSRTNLIVNAVERCLVDGIWQKTRKARVQKDSSPQNYRPPKELVSATNLMLELAFVLETLLKKPDPDSPQFEQASRIYLDARESLAQLKNDLAC